MLLLEQSVHTLYCKGWLLAFPITNDCFTDGSQDRGGEEDCLEFSFNK